MKKISLLLLSIIITLTVHASDKFQIQRANLCKNFEYSIKKACKQFPEGSREYNAAIADAYIQYEYNLQQWREYLHEVIRLDMRLHDIKTTEKGKLLIQKLLKEVHEEIEINLPAVLPPRRPLFSLYTDRSYLSDILPKSFLKRELTPDQPPIIHSLKRTGYTLMAELTLPVISNQKAAKQEILQSPLQDILGWSSTYPDVLLPSEIDELAKQNK